MASWRLDTLDGVSGQHDLVARAGTFFGPRPLLSVDGSAVALYGPGAGEATFDGMNEERFLATVETGDTVTLHGAPRSPATRRRGREVQWTPTEPCIFEDDHVEADGDGSVLYVEGDLRVEGSSFTNHSGPSVVFCDSFGTDVVERNHVTYGIATDANLGTSLRVRFGFDATADHDLGGTVSVSCSTAGCARALAP